MIGMKSIYIHSNGMEDPGGRPIKRSSEWFNLVNYILRNYSKYQYNFFFNMYHLVMLVTCSTHILVKSHNNWYTSTTDLQV